MNFSGMLGKLRARLSCAYHASRLRGRLGNAGLHYSDYHQLQLQRSLEKKDAGVPGRVREFIGILNDLVDLRQMQVLCVGCRNLSEIGLFQVSGVAGVVGIDLFSQSKDILVMDMHRMQFNAERFDLVYSSHSLEHALYPEQVVREMVRVVRNHGCIAVEVPVGFQPQGADLIDFGSAATLLKFFEGHVETVLWTEETSQYVRVLIKIIK